MASSEPGVNMLMWLFVAVTHSAREASLDEIPQQFDDTLSAAFNHKSRHVNSSDGGDAKGRLIEHELGQFLRYGSNKQGKFSHRMTERRLHELHQERFRLTTLGSKAFTLQSSSPSYTAAATSYPWALKLQLKHGSLTR